MTGFQRMRREGARVMLGAFLAVGAIACGSGAGAMACSDFMELAGRERTAAFVDAVEDRGLRLTGPDWQIEMQASIVEGYCMQRPSDTLDDGLDFVGVPSR